MVSIIQNIDGYFQVVRRENGCGHYSTEQWESAEDAQSLARFWADFYHLELAV